MSLAVAKYWEGRIKDKCLNDNYDQFEDVWIEWDPNEAAFMVYYYTDCGQGEFQVKFDFDIIKFNF